MSITSCVVQVLQPAIELGENGFPVSPITAFYWGMGAKQLKEQGGSGIKALLQPDGSAPKAGQLQKNAHLAATFRSLAEHGAEEGELNLSSFLFCLTLFLLFLPQPEYLSQLLDKKVWAVEFRDVGCFSDVMTFPLFIVSVWLLSLVFLSCELAAAVQVSFQAGHMHEAALNADATD